MPGLSPAQTLLIELSPVVPTMPQNIQDIRRDLAGISLLDDLRTSLRPHDGGEKSLPTLLLYDEQGLKLFEDITYLDEYYLTNAEIEVLENSAAAIADLVPGDCDVLELGSGYELTLFKHNCALFEATTTAFPVNSKALIVQQ